MIFSLTEQQEAIRDSVARLAVGLLAPHYRQREQDGLIERSTALLLGELSCLGRVHIFSQVIEFKYNFYLSRFLRLAKNQAVAYIL